MLRSARSAVALVCAVICIACGSSRDGQSRDTGRASGDTTVVLSKGDGVWGPVHDLTEVLRVPGNTKETTFGRIQNLAAAADGGVFVFDTKGPDGAIVRQFDANGRFVRNIGREGHGPGEYSGPVVSVVESNGVIVVRDMATISRFLSSGKFIDGFSIGHSAGIIDVAQAADGSIYTTAPRTVERPRPGQQNARRVQPVFHYDSAGRLVDSSAGEWLHMNAQSGNPPSSFAAHETRFSLSDGRVVVGRSDVLGFLVIDPSRRHVPLLAKYDAPPVPYPHDQLIELQAAQRKPIDAGGERLPNPDAAAEVTKFKLPLISIRPDRDGRIWILTAGPSRKLAEPYCNSYVDEHCVGKSSWSETNRVLGFRADGTFLGEIRFPKRSGSPAYVGDYVWCVAYDSDDVPTLVKYKLPGPS